MSTWLIYFATVLVVSATPARKHAAGHDPRHRFCLRCTTPTPAGLLLALALIMGLSAAGLGALLVTSEMAVWPIRHAGAAYLLWLGIKPGAASRRPWLKVRRKQAGSGWAGFCTGFLVAMSNPESHCVFYRAVSRSSWTRPSRKAATVDFGGDVFVIETSW